MTKEQKDLLLKDLGARLPHHVKVRYSSTKQFFVCNLQAMNPSYTMVDLWSKEACFTSVDISKIQPYLFPLLSMTEEQEKECQQIKHSYYYDDDSFVLFDWYNKNHFDYRGLIEKGLALDATNKNIY